MADNGVADTEEGRDGMEGEGGRLDIGVGVGALKAADTGVKRTGGLVGDGGGANSEVEVVRALVPLDAEVTASDEREAPRVVLWPIWARESYKSMP